MSFTVGPGVSLPHPPDQPFPIPWNAGTAPQP